MKEIEVKIPLLKTIEWDTKTGRAPKKDQFIKDYYGTSWKVIDKHGNRITLVEVL